MFLHSFIALASKLKEFSNYLPILPNFSKEVSQLTDWHIQQITNYLDLVYKHSREASKKFQKDISSRTGDIIIFVYFQ